MKINRCKFLFTAIAVTVSLCASAQVSWFCDMGLSSSGQVSSPYIKSGTVYFDATTLTYTLDNAVISNTNSSPVISDGNIGRAHNIVVKGNCEINTTSSWGISCYGNITIKGTSTNDKLTITSNSQGITCYSNLIVQDCSFKANGTNYGLAGSVFSSYVSTIYFNNCKAEISGTKSAIDDISSVSFKNCQITSPAISTITFNNKLYVYKSDNSYVKRLVIDVAKPTDAIAFEDSAVETLCVSKWDTNGDGKLSFNEAAAVTSLGNTFYAKGITAFNELQYFSGLTEINESAFASCTSLKSITLPDNITKICNKAFQQTSLLEIGVPSDNKIESIGDYAFMFSGVSSFIGTSLKSIGNYAFGGASSLGNIKLSSQLTTIGNYAFTSCSSLNVTLPSSITSIGKYAFYNCKALTKDQILGEAGKTLKMGYKAFDSSGVSKMTIGCTGNGAFSVDSCFFGNTKDFKLYFHSNIFYWARHTLASTWAEKDRNCILPYALCDDNNKAIVCFDIDVSQLQGYAMIVSNYNASARNLYTVYLGTYASIPAGTPVVVLCTPTGGKYIYFNAASAPLEPSKYNNLLVGTTASTYLQPSAKATYIYSSADGKFHHVSTTNWRDNLVPGCSAYLKLPDEYDSIDVLPFGGNDPTGGITTTKGDIDNNGVVDVTDLNILINIILGKSSASNYGGRADVTGEGNIDVSDINAVINIILGK